MRSKRSFLSALALQLVCVAPVQAQTRFRLADPLTVSGNGQGWRVDPATGSLGMTFPVAEVPGEMPIPVVFRNVGSFASDRTGKEIRRYNIDGTYTSTWVPCDRDRPIWGSLHFGFISPAKNYSGITEPGTQMMEDGTQFRDEDWVGELTGWTLPQAYGMTMPSVPAKVDSSGRIAYYDATLSELGTWSTRVQQLTPVGYGSAPTQFKVLMDAGRARIYAYLSVFNAWAPILWLDRFGHHVGFQWTQTSWNGFQAHTVKVLNHRNTGVQVAWAVQTTNMSTETDLLRVDFIGVGAPALLVKGYWGTSGTRPAGMAASTASFRQVVGPIAPAPICRPTRIRIAAPGSLPVPGFVTSVPPATPATSAPEMAWSFAYDTNLAELTSFTDALSVQTAFSYQTYSFWGDYNNSLRGVTQAPSQDLVTGVTLSRTWGRTVPASSGSPWTTVFTEGYSDGSGADAKTTTYDFGTSGPSYGNAAPQSVKVSGGGVEQITLFGQNTVGTDMSLTLPGSIKVRRTGSPEVVISQSYNTYGTQVRSKSVYVGGTQVESTTYAYDENGSLLDRGRLKTVTMQRFSLPSVTMRNEYSAKGQLTKSYVEGGGMQKGQTFGYDSEGRLTSTANFASWSTVNALSQSLGLGANGLPSSSTTTGNSIGTLSESWSYDTAYRPTSATDPEGRVTTTAYDIRGRVCSVSRTGEPTVTFSYPDERTVTTTQAGLSATERYDGFGRLQSRNRPDGITETYTYDIHGRVVAVRESSVGSSRTSSADFDVLGRPKWIAPVSGPTQSFSYSAVGANSRTTITQSNGVTVTRTVDPFGQVLEQAGPTGTTTATYNAFGQATKVTLRDLGGATQDRTFEYDGIGRLTSKTEPETGTIGFNGFDANGQPTTITEGGRSRTVSYDALGRLRSVSGGGASLTYTYTGLLLTSASGSDGVSQSYAYNGPGKRLSTETTTVNGVGRTISYGYDSYGRLSSLTYPSGRSVGYGYDGASRVNSVTMNGASLATVSYDGWGNRSQVSFASGAYSRWSADAAGVRLSDWTIGFSGGTDGRTFQYDSGENLTKAGEWTLAHDDAGRLTRADGFGMTTTHGHDGFGNNTSHQAAGSVPAAFNNFTFNPMTNNRIPPQATSGAYTGWTYNANGEATQIGTTTGAGAVLGLGWDGLGRLRTVAASSTGATQTYTYAPSGMRVQVKDSQDAGRSRQYAYTTGGLLLGEYLGTGTWKRDVVYLGSEAIAEVDGSGTHELHNDHLGTPRVVTNRSTAQIEGKQAFGPWGELINTPSATWGYQPVTGYTGHLQTDSTGLIYMRGRYFSPAWHRFVNSDHGMDPMSWNQNAYVGGSPFQAVDPSGMAQVRANCADGRTVLLEVPDGTSPEEARRRAEAACGGGSATVTVSGSSSSIPFVSLGGGGFASSGGGGFASSGGGGSVPTVVSRQTPKDGDPCADITTIPGVIGNMIAGHNARIEAMPAPRINSRGTQIAVEALRPRPSAFARGAARLLGPWLGNLSMAAETANYSVKSNPTVEDQFNYGSNMVMGVVGTYGGIPGGIASIPYSLVSWLYPRGYYGYIEDAGKNKIPAGCRR